MSGDKRLMVLQILIQIYMSKNNSISKSLFFEKCILMENDFSVGRHFWGFALLKKSLFEVCKDFFNTKINLVL
jgi:hypothetical protein